MAVYIHHAETGSYKTSGAINDHVIPAIKKGRVIVTNIRGMSTARCYEVFPEAPDSFELIHIDTSTSEGRNKISTWFHWVPLGALLILDEATSCFPKSWRQADIDKLDYPGGLDQAKLDNRPPNWQEAWQMHRHFGWEIVLTTPDIKSLRDDIRGSCDIAFQHKKRSHIGLSGYLEGMHNADKNRCSPDDDIVTKKVPKQVFELYDSTADGEITKARASRPIWKHRKILFGLAVIALSFGFALNSIFSGESRFIAKTLGVNAQDTETIPSTTPPSEEVDSSSRSSSTAVSRNVTPPPRTYNVIAPLTGLHVFVDGYMHLSKSGAPLIYFRLEKEGYEPFIQDSNDLRRLGYSISVITSCVVRLDFNGSSSWAYCAQPTESKDKVVKEAFTM